MNLFNISQFALLPFLSILLFNSNSSAQLLSDCEISDERWELSVLEGDNGVLFKFPQQDFDQFFPSFGPGNNKALSNFILQHFNDDFDFLIFIANTSALTNPNISASYQRVSNSITGTGVDLFDNTGEYGSQGKLSGIVVINRRGILGVLTHEWLHQISSNQVL